MKNMKHYSITTYRNSRGVALLAALMLVIMFTIIGIQLAQRGKQNANITGATVRHDVVFEAAETTLRNAILFINNFDGSEPPLATDNGATTNGINVATNFNRNNIADKSTQLASDPGYSFIWKRGTLATAICAADNSDCTCNNGDGSSGACTSGIDFVNKINSSFWTTKAIPSTFTGLDANNYIGTTRTYAFIEILRKVGSDMTGGTSNLSSSTNRGYYYLITVKASGFPPGEAPNANTSNARENVLVQAVYAQKF